MRRVIAIRVPRRIGRTARPRPDAPAEFVSAWVFSLPIWVYRLFMLAWALWLAHALLFWLRWAWSCFNAGGFWPASLRREAPRPESS